MEDRKLNFSAPLLSTRRFTIVKLPVDRTTHDSEPSLDHPNNGGKVFEVLKQRVEKKHSEKMESKEKMGGGKVFPSFRDDDETEEVYSEALDTISMAEAFSMICSASGVSNCETSKDSGTFLTDNQVQDFMMSRFLPAAKAMALQPSLSSSKKLPAVVEQERQVSRVVSMERKAAAKIMENILSDLKVEDEVEDDTSSVSVGISTKGCGLLPRLCLKGSLSFINPIPGTKMKCKPSSPPLPEPLKPIKRSGSPFRKFPSISTMNSKQDLPPQPPRLLEDAKKLKFGSNQFNLGGEQPSMSRTSSPLRRSGVLSPNRARSPQRPNRLPSYRGGIKSQDFLTHPTAKQWSCPLIPAIEKKMYVDGVNKPGKTKSRELSVGKKTREDQASNVSMALVPVKSGSDYGCLEEDNDFGVMVAAPAPPRLPKSPSESWLWRTLPSMPRNSVNQMNGRSFQSKWEDSKPSPEETKWENILKSAYLYRNRTQFSEELVPTSRQVK